MPTIETKKPRNSNIELLKIFAMILICISHVYCATGYQDLNAAIPSLNPSNWILEIFKIAGWVGDYIFIACSAYYLVGYKKLNIRKIILYYFDVAFIFFAYLGIYSIVYAARGIHFGADFQKNIINTFTTFSVFHHWYITGYLIFLILLPLWSRLVEKFSQKFLFWFNIGLLAIQLALFVLYLCFDITSWLRDLTFFMMYSFFAYGKKYGHYLFMKENDNKKNAWILTISCVLLVLTVVGFNLVCYYCNFNKIDMTHSVYFFNPLLFFIAIPAFLLCLAKEEKHNKVINYISSLSLIFYVMHENVYSDLLFDPLTQYWFSHMGVDIRVIAILVLSVLRFVFGISASVLYKETVHRGLVFLTNLGKKPKQVESK